MHVLVLTLYFPNVLLQEAYGDVAERVRQDELTGTAQNTGQNKCGVQKVFGPAGS